MDAIGPLGRRLRQLLASERGMALPTALFALIATFALASVAILSSVDAQHGTLRDRDSKEAIAAADAGASVALLRLNRFQGSLSEATPCIGPGGESVGVEANGWCPATPAENVGESTFSYQVSGFESNAELSVVAVGTSGSVSRRIEVGLVSYDGELVFANEKLIGQDDVNLEGTPDIRTDLGTNGSVHGNGSYTICGDIRHGVGKEAPEPDCDGEVTEGNKVLPPVTLPADIATNNSNCRLEADPENSALSTCDDPTEVDTYSKHRNSTTPWDPVTRTITVTSNATMTMGGQDYFVCQLFVDNGDLIMAGADEVQVRIFFDTPENCGLSAGDTQLRIGGNGNVVSTGFNPSEESYRVPGFYLLGSLTTPTSVELTGHSGTNELILYAPNSDVELGGNAKWIGMIAGKSLRMHGTPIVESDPNIEPPDEAFSTLWGRTHYVECTGASASPPSADC